MAGARLQLLPKPKVTYTLYDHKSSYITPTAQALVHSELTSVMILAALSQPQQQLAITCFLVTTKATAWHAWRSQLSVVCKPLKRPGEYVATLRTTLAVMHNYSVLPENRPRNTTSLSYPPPEPGCLSVLRTHCGPRSTSIVCASRSV
jgi:hypothetical protein